MKLWLSIALAAAGIAAAAIGGRLYADRLESDRIEEAAKTVRMCTRAREELSAYEQHRATVDMETEKVVRLKVRICESEGR